MSGSPRLARSRQSGLVLVGVMVALALAALGASFVGQRLHDSRVRDAEEDLLWVGEQYRLAIESYWRDTPGGLRTLPTNLEDLVRDPRFPQVRRHLRKLYPDPTAPERAWALVRQGNALMGVHSQSEGEPFRKTGFSDKQPGFDVAKTYAEWQFVFKPTSVGVPQRGGVPLPPIGGRLQPSSASGAAP
jgi:type II secretory pathway pseudopilin PulG